MSLVLNPQWDARVSVSLEFSIIQHCRQLFHSPVDSRHSAKRMVESLPDKTCVFIFGVECCQCCSTSCRHTNDPVPIHLLSNIVFLAIDHDCIVVWYVLESPVYFNKLRKLHSHIQLKLVNLNMAAFLRKTYHCNVNPGHNIFPAQLSGLKQDA